MKKIYKMVIPLFLFVLTLGMTAFAKEYSADQPEYMEEELELQELEDEAKETPTKEKDGLYIMVTNADGTNHLYSATDGYSDNFPKNIIVNEENATVTLDNYNGKELRIANYHHIYDNNVKLSRLEANNYTLELRGENTVDTLSYPNLGYQSPITITGEGTLTLHSTLESTRTFTMKSGTLNIIIEDVPENPEWYKSYKFGIDGHEVSFLGGNVNIRSNYSGFNCGIHARNGNVEVRNTTINIDADASYGLAIGNAYSDEEDIIIEGGNLTLENAFINIKTYDTERPFSAYFYNLNDISGHYFYVGENAAEYSADFDETFWKNDLRGNRYQCHDACLFISPTKLDLPKKPANTSDPEPDSTNNALEKFTDVHESDWFKDYVNYVLNKGIMTGKDETTFAPDENLSRAQFATILWRMEGSQPIDYNPDAFPDIADGQFYSTPAMWAHGTGVISGYDNGRFGPADDITREQMAVMMFRYASYLQLDTSARADLYSLFPDADRVSGFAQEAVEWAVAIGLITGDQGNINPQGSATRAQCAAIIQRYMEAYGL